MKTDCVAVKSETTIPMERLKTFLAGMLAGNCLIVSYVTFFSAFIHLTGGYRKSEENLVGSVIVFGFLFIMFEGAAAWVSWYSTRRSSDICDGAPIEELSDEDYLLDLEENRMIALKRAWKYFNPIAIVIWVPILIVLGVRYLFTGK